MPKLNQFEVEYAKSSMATCRVCMAKIPKEALRVGHVQIDADAAGPLLENDAYAAAATDDKQDKRAAAIAGATRWHHFECFPRMKGSKWMFANLPKDPTWMRGFNAVKKADQKKLVQLWKAILGAAGSGAGKSASTAAEAGKTASGSKRKASGGDSNAAKKARSDAAAKMHKLTSPQGVLSAKDHKSIKALEESLASKSTAQLHAELLLNKQVRSGKKEELIQRVAEGRVLGSLPACPRCKKGQIHWSRIGGWHSCPGYFNKDAKSTVPCYFRSKDMKRGKWKVKK